MGQNQDNRVKGLVEGFGTRLRERREGLGWTQQIAAEKLDLSTEAYGRLERSVSLPSLETLIRACIAMDIDADVLLGLDELPVLDDSDASDDHDVLVTRITMSLDGLDLEALRFLYKAVVFARKRPGFGGDE